jgi:polyphosphate glucokinase
VKIWNHRLAKAIDSVRALVNFDHLYLGGGNSRRVRLRLPRDVTVVDNSAGILGGVKLWSDRQLGAPRRRRRARAKHAAAR